MTPTATPAETTPSHGPLFIDPQGDAPLRAEVFGSERLEAYARELAAACEVTQRPPVRQPRPQRLRENGRFLAEAHREVAEASRNREPLTPDAEWVLDNYYIVAEVFREVRQDLPRGYYDELPFLASGPLRGYPRVYAL